MGFVAQGLALNCHKDRLRPAIFCFYGKRNPIQSTTREFVRAITAASPPRQSSLACRF